MKRPTSPVSAILLDIEGTVAPIAFVHQTLFPFARLKLDDFLSRRRSDPPVADALAKVAAETKSTDAQLREAILGLMDRDAKSTGLKQLQGLIWAEGYAAGTLHSPLFPDVLPALHQWRAGGKKIAIYSSGSVAAQKTFFAHTDAGDLTPLLSAYFDTTTGPKRSPDSYRAIANALAFEPGQIFFCTDVAEEANAAMDAGLQAAILCRPGNAPLTARSTARQVESFAPLMFEAPPDGKRSSPRL